MARSKPPTDTPGEKPDLPDIRPEDAATLKDLIDLRFTHLLRSQLEPREMVAVLKEAMAWHEATADRGFGSKLGRTIRDE